MKDCESTAAPLPPIGTKVLVTDGEIPGVVRGYGYITPQGQDAHLGTVAGLIPVVILSLGRLSHWFPGKEQECYVNTLTVHPDNLTFPLTDTEFANFAERE